MITGGYTRKCDWCQGQAAFIKPVCGTARWHCYGCDVKGRCDIPNDPDKCWTWQGARRGEYGVLWVVHNRKRYMRHAHRVAHAVWNGPIAKSWAVLHHDWCANKLCCNPTHLYLKQQPLELGSGEAIELQFR